MSGQELNPQQNAVVSALGGDVVVRAGAGTGKTSTLTARFVAALAPGPAWEGSSAERLLTITFTNKAAGEIAERIRRALIASGDIDQARTLPLAWISTVDAFCSRILRFHALEAGIDPSFTLLGEVEREELRDRVLRGVLGDDPTFVGLASEYGRGVVRARILDAYDRIASMGADVDAVSYAMAPDLTMGLRELSDLLKAYRQEVDAIEAQNATQRRNLDTIGRIQEELAAWDSEDIDQVRLLDLLCSSSVSAGARPKELARAIQGSVASLEDGLATSLTRDHASSFRELLVRFSRAYEKEKIRRAAFDYSDLVRIATRLLNDRPEIARTLAARFDLMMVDEFQDTNQAQMDLIEPLRRANLCVVGDDKQSIYGFRYADVAVFNRLADDVGGAMPLSINYRSHPSVLEAVNGLFASGVLFGQQLQQLQPGRSIETASDFPDAMSRVQVSVSDSSRRQGVVRREAEARLVADKVAEVVEAGVGPGDIVVLLRAMSGAGSYAQAIRAHGVEVELASGEAFHDSLEVAELTALMRASVVPDDDLAMAQHLSGRLVGLSPEAIYGLRVGYAEGTLSEALESAIDEWPPGLRDPEDRDRAIKAAESLRELRRLQASVDAAEFLQFACAQTGYQAVLSAEGRAGLRAWANVQKLIGIAARLERDRPAGIGVLLEYLSKHREAVPSEPSASTECQGSSVRIMSVHAAKGLEFPVVIVGDLGRPIDRVDAPRILLDAIEGDLRLALKHPPDGSAGERSCDVWYADVREQLSAAEREEEQRIFYVACTRAREALFMVGDAKIECPSDRSMIGLVLQALGKPTEPGECRLGNGAFSVEIHAADEWDDQKEPSEVARSAGSVKSAGPAPTSSGAGGRVEPGVGGERDGHDKDPTRTRLSYSALHRFDECPLGYWLAANGMRHRRGTRGQSAVGFGSAVHAALEATDFGAGTTGLVDSVVDIYELDEGGRDRLLKALQAVSVSPLAETLREAEWVDREVPFALPIAGADLVGSIDLVVRDGDRSLIVDYKTGSDSEASDSPERRRGYELQARCYALAELKRGASSVEVRFVFVEQGPREIVMSFSAGERSEIEAELASRIGRVLAASVAAPEPTPSPAACGGCPGTLGICEATVAR